ncbi:zinc knuckle family protein [Puccinia sorghi]|uniref:Zinc knuckle family protein n=1 Tax=Puccinia sorghi TaxID=27349 RepID=A0A0L6UW44_9BASI|nr:zinc knuckle family protein [Puccinia sorghi]
MYQDSLHAVPTFNAQLKIIDSVLSPYCSVSVSEETVSSAEVPKQTEVTAIAAQNNTCHICKKPGHWSPNCEFVTNPPPSKSSS